MGTSEKSEIVGSIGELGKFYTQHKLFSLFAHILYLARGILFVNRLRTVVTEDTVYKYIFVQLHPSLPCLSL